MIPEKLKKEIDEMTFESMMWLWRFSPAGYEMFQGESGKYFAEVMKEKREKITDEEYVKISKRIGW